MRTQNIQSAISIEYPEYITQINDRNIIKVHSLTNDTVAAKLTLSCNGVSVILEYNSELTYLLFHINSSIKRLVNGQHNMVTVTGKVSNGGVSYDITQFVMCVELGRTLNTRPHGCCRVMYYQNDEDLEKVNIYVPISASATVGQYVYTLQAGVNSVNLTEYNQSPITPPSGDFNIAIHLSYSHSDDPVFFGDLWKHTSGNILDNADYNIKMVNIPAGTDCSSNNTISYGKIRFLDTDGCYKTFIGKVMQIKYSNKQSEYVNNDLVVNNPAAHITEVGEEVSIGFENVEHTAYIHDILFSTHIMYLNGYNEWKDCIIADSNLSEKNPDFNDVEIKLKVLA